ncbi:MAG: hypothetical protein PHD62_03435 [Bacteroidales bacterium]|nr:hypothetical protein [Bacteroidales bacterium]
MDERKIPKYRQKDVLNILQISQPTLYRLRKENGLLTPIIKRRFTEEEIEELSLLIVNKYKVK